jgi:hypothetical protein
MMELSRQLLLRESSALFLEFIAFSTVPASTATDIGIGKVVGVALRTVGLVSVMRAICIAVFAFQHAASAANAVTSPIGANARVFRGVLVTASAMGLFTPVVPATSHVFFMGDGFQVSRIDTSRRSASVVQFKSLRDRTNEVFVHHPVSATTFLLPVAKTISRTGDSPSPEPAVIGFSDRDIFGQQFFERLRLVGHSGNSNFPDCRGGRIRENSLAHLI